MKKLNLGCGDRLNPTWTNVDIASRVRSVLVHDLRTPLPFSDASFGFVYHSHVLEHLRPNEAVKFISECFRVLETGGVIRVVVPDLEQIVIQYINNLQRCRNGEVGAVADYEWIMLEMYDQTVRERSGGEMMRFIQNRDLQNREYILKRVGNEARMLLKGGEPPSIAASVPASRRQSFAKRFLLSAAKTVELAKPRKLRAFLRNRILTPYDKHALAIGQFRLAGEVHQCMYDSFSLSRLLEIAGFTEVRVMTACESVVPNWREEGLDTDASGNPFKPDSLFVEASKL